MIQEQGVLGMSIKPEVEFAPLDISNLGDALISVTFPRPVDRDHSDDQDQGSDRSERDEQGVGTATPLDETLTSLQKDDPKRFDGQIYTLTGPETTTGPKLVDELNRVLSANGKVHSTSDHQVRNTGYVALSEDIFY